MAVQKKPWWQFSIVDRRSKYSEAGILKFHGMGPGSIPRLRDALKRAGLSFKAWFFIDLHPT